MNFKTHAPERRKGTTLQPNIHKGNITFEKLRRQAGEGRMSRATVSKRRGRLPDRDIFFTK